MKASLKKPSILLFILNLFLSQTTISMEPLNIGHNVSKDSLTALYKGYSSQSYFYVPEERSIDVNGTPIDLKKLLNSNGFCTIGINSMTAWSDQDWKNNLYKLVHGVKSQEEANLHKNAEENFNREFKETGEINQDLFIIILNRTDYNNNKRSLDELSTLLIDAKIVLKSFLPKENTDFFYNQKNFFKKTGINRLFTYAKLKQVLAEKQLTHIRLPSKILLIKDTKSGEYITKEDALNVIDHNLKVCIFKDLTFAIQFISDRYAIEILATKEKSEGKGLSAETMKELFILCNSAPFDIGSDNIFWDINGDAIIIDTEYKGETKHDCHKLNRYPVIDQDVQ